MGKTLRGKYVVVSTKMRSNSVYSKGAHWEKQGLNPGFNFFLCLREKEWFFFGFFFSFFFPFAFLFSFSFFFGGSAQVGPRSNVLIGTNWHFQGGSKLSQKKARKKTGKKACNGRGPIRTREEHVGKNKVWNVQILSLWNDIIQTLWFPTSPLGVHFGSLP